MNQDLNRGAPCPDFRTWVPQSSVIPTEEKRRNLRFFAVWRERAPILCDFRRGWVQEPFMQSS